MRAAGWKTVIIDKHVSLGYQQGCMLVSGDEEMEIPLDQIRTVIVNTGQARITSYLLTELSNRKVKTIFCDHGHNPVSELVGYRDNGLAAGRLEEQTRWDKESKDTMWAEVVRAKIENQNSLIIHLGFGDNLMLNRYLCQIEPGDPTNREGQAARIYFDEIFGREFIRGNKDEINAMLNYGYAILLSSFNRAVVEHGYHAAMGIHHCNRFNPYNLSSDLMEPFRPFVDLIAFRMRGRTMDKQVKKELVKVTYLGMTYGGKRMELQSAIDSYVPSVLKNVGNPGYQIPPMEYLDEG